MAHWMQEQSLPPTDTTVGGRLRLRLVAAEADREGVGGTGPRLGVEEEERKRAQRTWLLWPE